MAGAAQASGRFANLRKGAVRVGLLRLLLLVVLIAGAVAFARYSWAVPLADEAETLLYDARAWRAMPRVAGPDQRIVLITYNDDTLRDTGRRSPLDRGLLARVLARLDKLGPKAIGIDILIDQAQPEDEMLIAALRGMRVPTYLALGISQNNPDTVLFWQEEFQRAFHAKLKPGNVHPASIYLESDPDNVIRSWPVRPPGEEPMLVTRMAGDGGFKSYTGSIAFRLPQNEERTANDTRKVFDNLPITLFDSDLGAAFLKNQIAGRYVLIGGDITDSDRVDTPASRFTGQDIFGLQVHATLLAQQLDGKLLPPIPPFVLWVAAALIVAAAAGTGLSEFGGWKVVALLLVQLAAIAGTPFVLQAQGFDTRMVPAFGWIVGWVIAYSAAAAVARGMGSEQRKFAQSALGRYLPRDVAREILRDPDRLNLSGERRTIYALFSDLEGFTELTHAIEPEMVATLLNRYLDRLSGIVLAHGGTIDKFIGDAIVAFWGAPIARPTDGEMAMRAAIAIAEAGDAFRAGAPEGLPPIGRTRVGLHRGEAIVGNFGGDDRIQYTALGDAMNTASRLEGANKALRTRVLISSEAIDGDAPVPLRAMGRITVRGRSSPLVVFEPVDADQAESATQLTALVERFDAEDSDALAAIEAYSAARPDDAALKNLAHRLGVVGAGGCFGLD